MACYPKFCKKCGWFKIAPEGYDRCPICKTELFPAPEVDDIFFDMSRTEMDAYILSHSETGKYDETLADKRRDTIRIEVEETRARSDAFDAQHAECIYCKSRNTKKISATSRLFSTGFFGLGSKKIGKQWHCNKCGSDF